MTAKVDRFFNPKDGTYANVPIVAIHPEIYRGKRPFGTNVLIGNWYEDQAKFKESPHRPKSSFRLEYPVHVGAVADTIIRRKCLGSKDPSPGRMILDHHDIDDQKQMISSYDEHYNRRGPYGEFQEPSERKWALQDDYWLPERSDHPLEGPPTKWGLIERKRAQSQCLLRQRTIPSISEYTNRYVPHRPEAYTVSKRINIPRIYTTSVDRSNSLTTNIQSRSISDFNRRPIVNTPDPMEIDYVTSPRRNTNIPRSYFCSGTMEKYTDKKIRKRLPSLIQSTNLTSSIEQFSSQEQTVSLD